MIFFIVSASIVIAAMVGIILAHARTIYYCATCGYIFPKDYPRHECCPRCHEYARREVSGL